MNEDGTITMLENPLRVKGDIYSEGDQIAFGNTTDITEVFAIASPTNYGLVKIDGRTVKVNPEGQLYTDVDGGISGIKPATGSGNVITSLSLSADGKYITPEKGLTALLVSAYTAGDVLLKLKTVDGSGSGLDADLLDGHHWSEIAGLNVASATKLLYARTINGTSFDGTANITTANWGTSRNFSISDGTNTGAVVSVNGSADRVLMLPSTIKATLVGNASSSTVATRLQTGRTIFGQYFDGSGNVSGAMSGVTRINSMIHLDVAGTVGIGDKSGSWARFMGNRLDGMTVGGVMSDLYLNYTSPAKNARVDKDGNLITSGNVISDDDQIAFGSAGDITEVFAIASPTNYGLVKIDGSTIKIGADGRLYSEGGGSFGNIDFSGSGAFLSDVTPSADKRTLTFTRVGKPSYTASEVGAVSKAGDTMSGLLQVNSHIRSKGGNINLGIVGITGGWERGLMWGNLDFSTTYGSVTMFGNVSTPGYISIGFGEYNDAKRAFFYPNGNLTAYSFNAGSAKIANVAIQGGNEINNEYSDLYINYRGNKNIIVNAGGGYLESRGWIYGYGYAVLYSGWFQNNASGTGLYNSAEDARWRAQSGRWESDKPIFINSIGGDGLTIVGNEATTVKLTGKIGVASNGPIHRYIVYWYNNYASFDVHGIIPSWILST